MQPGVVAFQSLDVVLAALQIGPWNHVLQSGENSTKLVGKLVLKSFELVPEDTNLMKQDVDVILRNGILQKLLQTIDIGLRVSKIILGSVSVRLRHHISR